jgi:hypothetical protein
MEQTVLLKCDRHLHSKIYAVCFQSKCEFGHFICEKCALDYPEHIMSHKVNIQLIDSLSEFKMNSEF